MSIIVADRVKSLRYTDSVGDTNSIHRSDASAKRYGLEGAIAPGMWLASHIQDREGISSIKQIKFSGSVPYGTNVDFSESRRMTSLDAGFTLDGNQVCYVKGIKKGGIYSSAPGDLSEVVHTFSVDICPERMALFLNSIGLASDSIVLPEMYLASLSAPALLSLGRERGLEGIHVSQSFNMHRRYAPGGIDVLIGDRREKGSLEYFDLRWIQNGEVVASGKSGVAILEKN